MAEANPQRGILREVAMSFVVAGLVVFVGWLDTVTGLRPDVTVLYLVPIGLATYEFGLWPGLLVAGAAAAAEILSHPGGERFSEVAIVADAITHLAVFVLAAVVVDRLLAQLREITRLEARRDFDLSVARDVYQTTLSLPATRRSDLSLGFSQAFAFELGGDYMHVSDTGDGMFVAVGDISGKGAAAALFSVTLHQEVLESVHATSDPAEVVRSVNRRLYQATPGQMFVTLFCAFIENGELRYVNGGHEPGFLLSPPEQPRQLLSERTLPLGIEPEVDAATTALPFSPGSLLLLVTDGVTESPRMQPHPYERLSSLLSAERDAPPQQVADRVFSEAAPRAAGETQRDDITVLCVRRSG